MRPVKFVKLPKIIDKNILELVGIAFGDGYLKGTKKGFLLTYSLDAKTDREYADYVRLLFYKIFKENLKFKVDNKNMINLWFLSKLMVEFMHNKLEIPYSPKKELEIPDYIKNKQENIKPFLRGLFDTDGCVTYIRTQKSITPIIKICTKFRIFAYQIQESLSNLNIKSYVNKKVDKRNSNWVGYDVVIYGKKRCDTWFDLIGSSNIKNILKYNKITKDKFI